MQKVIRVTKGVGTGETRMAAFDAALYAAGIANYNLVRLSSIIPPGFEVRVEQCNENDKNFGDRLYVVYASQVEDEVGKGAWAGIGWVLAQDGSGKGLFTEHEAHSEQEVRDLIQKTFTGMVKYRQEKYGPIKYAVSGLTCDGNPVCAFVAAVYTSVPWSVE